MFIGRSFFNMYVESFWIPANKPIVLQFHLSGKAKEVVIFYQQQKTQTNIWGRGKTVYVVFKYLSRSLLYKGYIKHHSFKSSQKDHLILKTHFTLP